jgi:hypothetical protein
MKKALFLFVMLCMIPQVLALDRIMSGAFVTITTGIFVTFAFVIVSFILKRNQLNIGPWVLIAFAVFFMTLGEFFRVFIKNLFIHQILLTASMVLLFFTALFKYWDTMRLIE